MHFPRVPHALTTSIANSAVLAALCVAVAGCGGAVDQQPPINGNVYLGAVSGAQVAAYAVDADGHIAATPLATTVTDADGHFVLPGTLRWPLLVKSTGGSYTEEATGATSAPGETSLSAVYLSAPSTMVLSPYSSAIVADALAAGALTASNVAAASTRVSAFLGGVDPQQTVPAFVAVGATLNTIADGNRMAFALGAESQSRTDIGASVATSVQNIVAQSAKGDTLAACHSGAGDVTADGTVSAPADDTCDVSAGALGFSTNPLNRSGVTALAMLGTTQAAGHQTASAEANACGDRVALLEQNRSLFEGRKNSVQASLLPGMTAANWSTYPTTSTWGPHAAIYGTISAPSTCHDQDTFRRELVMAIENYWVDQNLNYCHHHIPGWTPPENTGKTNYRESPPAPTDGGPVDPNAPKLTCTAQRGADGSQSVQTDSKQTPPVITSALMWNGADCSNFTSWVYNFAGLATNQLSGAIGVQACSTTSSGTDLLTGVLLDINRGNLSSTEQYLLPGDLLYITQKKIVGTGAFAADFKLAHVITWTGKRFSDLQAGPDRAKYDLSRIGRPDSRLGGDFLALLGPGDSAANLGQPGHDPWMIIDSHYAGPAYRPFLGWYAEHLSHVRRIIGADAVLTDPNLADYVIRPLSPAHKGLLTLASKNANATATSGYRLIYQTSGSQSCYQAGTP